MSTSSALSLLDTLTDLYSDASPNASADVQGVWDELLRQIQALIQNILNASIGANGLTINDLVEGIKSKINGIVTDITTSVNGVTSAIKTELTATVTGLETWFTGVIDTVSGKIDDVITAVDNSVTDIVEGVQEGITDIIGGIVDTLNTAISGLVDKITEIVDSIKNIGKEIGTWISNAIRDIGQYISDTATEIVNSVKGWLGDVYKSISDTATRLVQSIKDTVSEVYNNVKTWLTDTYNSISDTATRLVQAIKDTYESTKKTVIDWIEEVLNFAKEIKNAIEGWFHLQIQKVEDWYTHNIAPNLKAIKDISKMAVSIGSQIWDKIESGDYQGAFDMVNKMFTTLGIPAPFEIIHALLSMVAYFWETIRLQFVPLEVAASKRAEIALALDPIANGEAANGVYRGLWGTDGFYNNAALGGVAKERARISLETNRPLPTPGQAQQLFLRGEIDESAHDKILASYGFTDEHIGEIKSLYAIIPGVTDIIRMAVREAFTPEIATRFGQYEDLPEAFVSWASKQGLSEDWASRYWASHWELPSPNMGFEMYQRRIINKEDLTLLLKALDVMPFWREKLINLSYNPPTRVDVRRMYKMGVISEQDVYNFHLDIGYSPDNARLLTEFTKRYSAPEDVSEQDEFSSMARSTYSTAYKNRVISADEYKSFLKSLKYADEDIDLLVSLDDFAILQKESLFDPQTYRETYYKMVTSGYNRGLFNREDAKTTIIDLGLSEDQAELELNLIDYNRQVSLKDVLVQQLHNQYVTFIIDPVDLHSIMDTFGFYADEVDRLIEEWEVERSFRDKRPSVTDLKKFYNEGLITREEYLDELRGIGYHEKYIEMYNQMLSKAKG